MVGPPDSERDDAAAPESDQARHDRLVDDYRTILSELALLTTVSVLLFGFLLASPTSSGQAEEWLTPSPRSW